MVFFTSPLWHTMAAGIARRLLWGRALVVACLLMSAGLAQPEIDRVDALLEQGRAQEALELCVGTSFTVRLRRAEAMLALGDLNEGVRVAEALTATSSPSPAWNFRYFLLRGRCATVRQDHDSALRYFQSALRLAVTPAQKVEASDALCSLYERREMWEQIDDIQNSLEEAVASLNDATLARHLVHVASLQHSRGRHSEATASLAAARDLYSHLNMPVRVADVVSLMAEHSLRSGDLARSQERYVEALRKHVQAGEPEPLGKAVEAVASFDLLGLRSEQTSALLSSSLEKLPSGRWKDKAELELARSAFLGGGDSQAILERLLELYRRSDLDAPNRSLLLSLLGQIEGRLGNFPSAEAYLQEALKTAEPSFYSDRFPASAPGPLLFLLSDLKRQQQQFGEALTTLHRAIEAQPDADWSFWRMRVRYNAVIITLSTYDLEAARREFQAGLQAALEQESLAQRAGGVTRLIAALAINQSLGDDLIDPGERAMASYDPLAQSLLEEMLAPEGALESYLQLYRQWAVQTQERKDTLNLAHALLYQAVFLEAAGRRAEALHQVAEALAVTERHAMDREACIGYLLQARLHDAAGQPEAALASLRKMATHSLKTPAASRHFHHLILASYQLRNGHAEPALKTYERAADWLPSKAWLVLYGQVQALEALGQTQESLSLLEEALAQPEVAYRTVVKATMLSARARLLALSGQSELALSSFEASYPTLLATGEDQAVISTALAYARLLLELEQPSEAFLQARAALDALLTRGSCTPQALRPLFETTVALALETQQHDLALHYLELSRSAELLDSVELSQIETQEPATGSLLQELAELRGRLFALRREAARTEQGPKRDGLDKVLATTREQFFSKLDALKRDKPDFEALVSLSGSSLSAVQGALDEKTALIEFFPSEESLYIFVVTSDDLRLHQVLLGRDKLAGLVERYLQLASDPQSDIAAVEEVSQRLYGLLLEPALANLPERKRLRLVPSGPLWQVPFEALQNPNRSPLDNRYEVSYLTSADLLRTLAGKPSAEENEVVLLGAPDDDLPGALRELQTLAAKLPRAELLIGTNATSSALRAATPRANVLHIASHSGAGEKAGDCYITLADGAFPLEKIYGLTLQRGALVVLSSCRSARGESQPGREVTSLASAFHIAGASSVIASHWEVDDEFTQELFVVFYRYLQLGYSRGEALQMARRTMAKVHRHPYFWASFSLFGSPQ